MSEDLIVFVSIFLSLSLFPFRQTTSLVALFLPQFIRSLRSTSFGVSLCAYELREDGESNLAKVASSVYRQARGAISNF